MKTDDEPHGELTGQDTGNNSPAEPTEVQIKKPPPKKPVTVQICELCKVILTSQTIVDAHMGSRRHRNRTQALESQKTAIGQKKAAVPSTPLHRCDICNITLNSLQQKEIHLAGMKHTNKVKKIAEANEVGQGKDSSMIVNPAFKTKERAAPVSVPTGGSITDLSVPVQPADLKCTVCNITVNSVQQLTQHLSSKKHQSKKEGLQRAAPYHRPRRGGLGRGAPAPSGDLGAPGPRGRGKGWGRGRGGDGPKLGRINSLKSNFQSAGFTSNSQSLSGSQSLKRDRSPRNETSFGNGSNDDFSYNSYHQGNKIPRGEEIPFYNLDYMNHNSFRSGNNAFGGGKPSFGSAGGSSFEGGSNAFAGGNSSFGGGGGSSFEGGNNAFGGGTYSFGGANKSFGRGNPSFGGGSTSFEGGSSSFGCGNDFFGDGNDLYAGGHSSFAGVESSFGSANTFGDSNSPPCGGFGRGGIGGPMRRGRGFGQRGRGLGSLAQEGGF